MVVVFNYSYLKTQDYEPGSGFQIPIVKDCRCWIWYLFYMMTFDIIYGIWFQIGLLFFLKPALIWHGTCFQLRSKVFFILIIVNFVPKSHYTTLCFMPNITIFKWTSKIHKGYSIWKWGRGMNVIFCIWGSKMQFFIGGLQNSILLYRGSWKCHFVV